MLFDVLPLCKISGLLVHPFQSSSHISEKQFSRPHQVPGPNFGETRDTCQNIFLIFYLSAKFQVCWFIHSKDLAIFKKNSCQGPIRPWSKFWKKPDKYVKYFLALHLPAKFQFSRFIHSKFLAIFTRTAFKAPSGP